jgi:hypothetical protein
VLSVRSNQTTGGVVSPATKAKSARSPRTGGKAKAAKAKPKEAEPEDVQEQEDVEAETNGEVEEDEAKESARDIARREKEEKAAEEREAAIEAGELIVTDDYEFTISEKQTASAEQMVRIVDKFRGSDDPLVFNEVASEAGAKYPEDLVIAMYALEDLGLVQKFTAKSTSSEGAGRSRVAFLWVGDEAEE